jgi:hypothetical protein
MHRRTLISLGSSLFGACALLSAAEAAAQEDQIWRVLPPSNSPELQLSSGYAQGFGGLRPGRSLADVVGPGFAFAAGCDYRATRSVSFGIEAQYQVFAQESTTQSMGADVNIGATIHIVPSARTDPWVRIGAGYRLLWNAHPVGAPDTTDVFHGFDVANVRIGYDLRTSDNLALGPFLGANLQSFLWQNATLLPGVHWGSFLQAGLQGRFDTRTPEAVRIAERRSSGLQ